MVNTLNFFRRPATVGMLVFVGVMGVTQLFTYQRYVLVKHQQARELLNAANVVKEKIESTLANGMAAATTLNVMVKNYGVKDFDKISRNILELNRNIDGLSLVEGEIVTHIYPLKGNEAYLGYNIFKDTISNREIRKSLSKKEIYFAGPYALRQGGQGIIGRSPIFKDGKYYGFATALIKLSTFLKIADLDSPNNPHYIYQLSKIDSKTHKEAFFLPQSTDFDKDDAILLKVPQGDWNIYVQSANINLSLTLFSLIAIEILFALVAGILGWYIAKRPEELKKLVAEKMKLLQESELEYSSLFQQANDAILVVDNVGQLIDVNDSLCKMLQYSRGELLSMNVADILDSEELKHNPVAYDSIMRGDLVLRDRMLRKSNNEIAEAEMSVKKIAENKILVIARDVTEQRKTQKQIALSESTLRSAFDYSPIGMCLVSFGGAFLKTNNRLSEMLGYSEEEFLDLVFSDIIYPDDQEPDLPTLGITQTDELGSAGNEKRYITKDGAIIWINLIVSVVSDTNDAPLFYVCQIENITHIKQIAKQLSERVKELSCLYELSEISNRANPMSEIIEQFIEKIPQAYQHPEIASARIIFNGQVFETAYFKASIWRHQSDILLDDMHVGSIEVFYAAERDTEAEGPFLKEERLLINTLSDMLGNIAERKKAQWELAQSEEKFRTLVEQSLASVFIYQEDRFVYVNPAFKEATGYTEDQLINNISFQELIYAEDRILIDDSYFTQGNNEDKSDHYKLRLIKSDGHLRQMEMVTSTISYDGRPAIIGTIIDVTERMEEEKRIERAVTAAQEKERLEIGMELHDNVKQILAASKFRLSTLAKTLSEPGDALRIIDDLKANIAEAIHELRRLSHQLAPSVDPTLSLEDRIRALTSDMNMGDKLKISIDIEELLSPLEDNIQLALYRILQEQLVNIQKYAEASLVEIDVTSSYKGVLLRIIDNGKGYDTNVKKAGIGLENIKRRAQSLDGRVEIISSPGAGCKVIVYIPLN